MSRTQYTTQTNEHLVREYDWRSKVYTVTHRDSGLSAAEWRLLRDSVLRRDRYTCLRCDKKFRNKKEIGAHHLMPREDGGSNDLSNLATLCHVCHDYVEINHLRSRVEIIGSFETRTEAISEPETGEPDPYGRPEWHKYVYGGKRRGSH